MTYCVTSRPKKCHKLYHRLFLEQQTDCLPNLSKTGMARKDG